MHRHLASTHCIEQLISAASPAERDDLCRGMAALAYERGLWKEAQGQKLRLSFALRPWILSGQERRRVHALAWQLRMALRRLCWMTDAQPEFAQIVPLDPREVEWIHRYRKPDLEQRQGERVFCRLDALLQRGEGAALQVQWLEPNVVGIGGLSYSAALEAATCEVLLPWLQERDPSLSLERGDDGPRLLLAELCEHAEQLGVTGRPPVVALVDDFADYPLGGELARLRDFFATQCVQAVLIAPEALEAASEGRLIAEGLEIDQGTWSRALNAALSQPDRFVVQEYAAVDLQELTVVNEDGVRGGLHHRSAAVFPGREGVCLFGRFSSGSVVNIQQGGGVVAFMLERS